MKITYVVPRYLPDLGGIENHVAALATGAAAAGHQVTVLTQQEGVAAPTREIMDGVTVRRFPSGLSIRGQGLSPRLWWAVRHLGATTDILHVHNVHAATTLGVLVAARPGRIVVTPHYLGSGDGWLDRTLHHLYDPALAHALTKADAVICVSRAEADELGRDLSVAGARVHVIPNGVDVDALRHAHPAEAADPVVLVAGRLERYKQPALAVDALRYLPSEYTLVIAGSGPEAGALRRFAAASGVSSRVRLVGPLSSAELARWYRRAAVVVSMSRRECFGMTLAEGLAGGCGIVASDIPAHREVVAAAGWDARTLLPPDSNGPAVAAAIQYAALARVGFVDAVTTWADVVSDTLRLYEELGG
ncbi:MAG: glycosyltransferase family 4 protein [Terracoccus sp.]